jgi:lipoprotein-releasing system ATP-binding protein
MNEHTNVVMQIRGLERAYRTGSTTLQVLRGVDLDLRAGELVGLFGPSGSGKSSLLHAAGLLEKPTAGEVTIHGRECLGLGDRERTAIRRAEIGFVYQFHHLLPELKALENVILPQKMAGTGEREARQRAQMLLEQMGLKERMHHQPNQMSGGEQQRVAIARSLANSPSILLADEPTGNLDPATTGSVFQALFDLVRIQGVAALVATHNHELKEYMDRVFLIEDGLISEQ